MKSKLSHYPYARPQYEWEKTELFKKPTEIYETYNCEPFEDTAYYKAINGDLNEYTLKKGRTEIRKEPISYKFNKGSYVGSNNFQQYYVKPAKKYINYILNTEYDKKWIYTYCGWDIIDNFPTEIIFDDKLGLECEDKIHYYMYLWLKGVKLVHYKNNIYHIDFDSYEAGFQYTGDKYILTENAIKEIKNIPWYVDIWGAHNPDPWKKSLVYTCGTIWNLVDKINRIQPTSIYNDDYEISHNDNDSIILNKPADKWYNGQILHPNTFTGFDEWLNLIDLENKNFVDAKQMIDDGFDTIKINLEQGSHTVQLHNLEIKNKTQHLLLSEATGRPISDEKRWELGYTLDEIAIRRGRIEVSDEPLIPAEDEYIYTDPIKKYIVPSVEKIWRNNYLVHGETVYEDISSLLDTYLSYYEDSYSNTYYLKDITDKYCIGDYYCYEKNGPYNLDLLGDLNLDRTTNRITDIETIKKILSLSKTRFPHTEDCKVIEDIYIEYDNDNPEAAYFYFYEKHLTSINKEPEPLFRSYKILENCSIKTEDRPYLSIKYIYKVSMFNIIDEAYKDDWFEAGNIAWEGFETKKFGLDLSERYYCNITYNYEYGNWEYIAYNDDTYDIYLTWQNKPNFRDYTITKDEYVAAVGEETVVDKNTILWLYGDPDYYWEMPEIQDLPFAYSFGPVDKKTRYLIKEFDHYSVNTELNENTFKQKIDIDIDDEYKYLYIDGNDIRIEKYECSDIYDAYNEDHKVNKLNYDRYWESLKNISIVEDDGNNWYSHDAYKHLYNVIKDYNIITNEPPKPTLTPNDNDLISDEWAMNPFILIKNYLYYEIKYIYLWIPNEEIYNKVNEYWSEDFNMVKYDYNLKQTNKNTQCYLHIGLINNDEGEYYVKLPAIKNSYRGTGSKPTSSVILYKYDITNALAGVPLNYYSYSPWINVDEWGLQYRWTKSDKIVEYIYNDNPNYLPHEDSYDYDNLTATTYKDLAITIKNQLEIGEKDLLNNVSYTKTINDGDSIDFTTIASASITAQLNYPVEEANKLVGQNFTYLLDYGDGEWHNMGLFTIDEAESIDAYTSRITGHDHMYRLNKYIDDFIANYKYPTTLKQLWYDILDYCDIFHDKEEISGVNADLVLNRNFEAVKTSALQIAEYITQLMAGYAHINKDNFSATISHYESVPASVMPSNYTDISHSPYDSQVPNQIKMGYNNDKTVSTSEPISRYFEEDIPCEIINNTTYNEIIDSETYEFPDGQTITVNSDEEIRRAYKFPLTEYAPISYDSSNWEFNETFGVIKAQKEENSILYILTNAMLDDKAIDLVKKYESGEEVPQIKAVYTSRTYDLENNYKEYIDENGRVFAKVQYNEDIGRVLVINYNKVEDLVLLNRETHLEVDKYQYEFKVKEYTRTIEDIPLEEINEEIDTGKYLISIKGGHPTAKEYYYQLDTTFIPYYITDNSLITYNIDEDECKNIMANICDVLKELPLDYRKCDLTMLTPTANYEIKIGDIIEATNKLGKKFKMMVMEISIDGSGITYKSFGEAQYPVQGESISSQIIYLNDLQGQISEIRGDGQETKQELVQINATQTELVSAVNGLNQETIDLGENLVAVDEKYQEITNQITSDHDTDILAVYNAIDAKAEEVKGNAESYADNKDAEVLKAAKKYADDQDTTNLQAAKDYADTIKSLIPTGTTMYVDVQDNGISCIMWIGDADKRSGVKFEYWYKSNPVFINVNFYFNGERVPFTEQIRPGE